MQYGEEGKSVSGEVEKESEGKLSLWLKLMVRDIWKGANAWNNIDDKGLIGYNYYVLRKAGGKPALYSYKSLLKAR